MPRKLLTKRRQWGLTGIALVGALLIALLFTATRSLTGGKTVLVTAFDVLARAGETVTLRVKLQRGVGLRDIKNEPVTFRLPDGTAVTAVTDRQGVAAGDARFGSPGDLAVPVVLPERSASAATTASGQQCVRVFVRPPDVRIAVCDVDHTLADISALKVLYTPNEQTPALPGAREVLSRLAETHLIVYLTARDDKLLDKTRGWLAMKGFPDGPVFARDLGPDPISARKFKTTWLKAFKASWPNVEYGFGDRDEDAAAYDAAGIRSYIVRANPFDPAELPATATWVADWAAIGRQLFRQD